jgi:two-component system, chemotaxis family, chemotaxis protein CheY
MRRTVVIVEDVEQMAAPLEIALTQIRDLDVVTLLTAVEALRVLADEERRIVAVITDLNLPQMDGFELIDKIRRSQRHLAVPIIVVTGDGNPETRERVLRMGANAYYQKPYSPADVRHTLEDLINAR